MFRPALIGDILRLAGLILLAGILFYGLAILAVGALDLAEPYLGRSAGRLPDFGSPVTRDQLGALLVVWTVLAIGLGIWPFAQKIGRVIAEGIVFVIGVLAGARLHLSIEALVQGGDPARVLAAHGLLLGEFALLSLVVLWLPEACAGLRLPRALRFVALALVVAAAFTGLR